MYSEQMWQNAKKKCRLNDADIALAQASGADLPESDQKYPQQKRALERPG